MTIYCAPTGSGSENGSSWDNAIEGLAAAVAAASAEEIWCKEGTYNITTRIDLVDGCDIFGSFDSALTGTNGTKEGRDFDSDRTIIDCGDNDTVFQLANADIDGLQVQRGNSAFGGAIYGNGKAMEFRNCVFDDNIGDNYGSAMMLRGGTTWAVTDCIFTNGTAARGGAVGVRDSGTVVNFTRCVFGTSGNPNTCTIDAGAVYADGPSTINFVDCDFGYNTATGNCGAVMVTGSGTTATFNRCVLHHNAPANNAGALYIRGGASMELENCLIYANDASSGAGGAVRQQDTGCASEFINCVFADNTASSDTISAATGNVDLINCIMWDNTGGEIDATGATLSVTYSDIENGETGTGNINSDPLFVGSGDNPYAIGAGSPCIDAGDGDNAPATDYLEQSRYDDPATSNTGTGTPAYTDIGAYEYQGAPAGGGGKSMLMFAF